MISKKYPESDGREIPAEWKEEFKQILNSTFSSKVASANQIFETFGEIHADEISIVACLYDSVNLSLTPVSCFVSFELDEESKKNPKKSLAAMMDLCGLFFEEYFETPDFSDYEPNWQETEYKNQKYFFKITRENICLTMEANKILELDNKLN